MDSELEILNENQRMQYLRQCVKLAQENKITIKNAFDIQVIDQMIAFCKDSTYDKEKEKTDFSLASMSLHASGRVYGYRVDSLQLDALRFIWELPRTGRREAVPESQRAKKRRLSDYLADEGANDRPVDVDHALLRHPVLKEVDQNYSSALGRLVSYNLIPPETQGIDLAGESPWWVGDHLEKVTLKNRLIRIKKDLPLMIQCVELNFDMPATLNVKTEDDSFAFDPQADPMPETDNIAPVDIDEYDFADAPDAELDTPRFGAPGDFSEVYSKSFKSTGTNFAGPSNFRLKRYDILGTEKKCERSSCRKRMKDPKYLSFKDLPADLDDPVPDDSTRTELSGGTTEKWTKEANLLPVDSAPSSFARLAELFAFPNRPIPEDESDDEDQASNSHDDTNRTPFGFDDSGLGDDPSGTSGGADGTESDCEVPMGQFIEDLRYDTLISAPGLLAELITVAYTKSARDLNVRQMKQSFWKVLSNDVDAVKMSGERSFRNVFAEATSHMTSKNRLNINLPIAFVATLSLCNEKHLVLTPGKESADFTVSQAEVPQESKETNLSASRKRPRKSAS